MKVYLEPVARLINIFSKLPGVGGRNAQKYAYKVLEMSDSEANDFISAIRDVKEKVCFCKECGNFSEEEVCEICKMRNKKIICVVKEPKDVLAFEKLQEFDGVYHVLHGTISPLENKSAKDIRVKELVDRVTRDGAEEVIMALNPDAEGEVTSIYISSLLKPLGVKVTRLAQGVSVGADLEYQDTATLGIAFKSRRLM